VPSAITPLLMIGGAYLCYEGVEKIYELIAPHDAHAHEAELGTVALNATSLEDEKVAGAIKTDFILSAEIATPAPPGGGSRRRRQPGGTLELERLERLEVRSATSWSSHRRSPRRFRGLTLSARVRSGARTSDRLKGSPLRAEEVEPTPTAAITPRSKSCKRARSSHGIGTDNPAGYTISVAACRRTDTRKTIACQTSARMVQ